MIFWRLGGGAEDELLALRVLLLDLDAIFVSSQVDDEDFVSLAPELTLKTDRNLNRVSVDRQPSPAGAQNNPNPVQR